MMQMKHYLCLLVFLMGVGCQNNVPLDPLTQSQIKDLQATAGPLEVQFWSPEGGVESPRSVLVRFNQPMVSLEATKKATGDGPFEIRPYVAGRFLWLGSQAVAFYPEKDFELATNYTVKVPQSTQSLLGRALTKDFSWEFETPRPKVDRISPAKGAEMVDTHTDVDIQFNQPVEIADVHTYTQMNALIDGKKEDLTFSVVRVPKDSKNPIDEKTYLSRVRLKPSSEIPKNARIEIKIDKKFKAVEGKLGMKDAYSSYFTTHGDFTVGSIECERDCKTSGGIEFETSTPIEEKEFLSKISLMPKPEKEGYSYWSQSDKRIRYYVNLAPQTDYVLTLPADIEDRFGQILGKEVSLRFRTGDIPPQFNMRGGNGVLEVKGSKNYYAYGANIKEIKLKSWAVNDLQLLAYLRQERNNGESQGPQSSEKFREWTIPFKGESNKREFIEIPLDESLNQQPGGFLVLTSWSPQVFWTDSQTQEKHYRQSTAILQLTDLGITSKWSHDKSLIWVTTLSRGEPVKLARVSIRDKRGALLWSGQTDAQGLVQAPGREALEAKMNLSEADKKSYIEQELFVFAQSGKDEAFATDNWSDGFNPWDFGYYQDWYDSESNHLRLHMFTERGIYRPGEKVFVKGYIRDTSQGNLQFYKGNGELLLTDSKGRQLSKLDIDLTDNSSFSGEFVLPKNIPLGQSQIKFKIPGNKTSIGSATFRVDHYRAPDFQVKITGSKKPIFEGETEKVDILGEYLFGAPMRGSKISWFITRQKAYFTPPGEENDDYTWWKENFYDEEYDDTEQSEIIESRGNLNDQGIKSVLLDFKEPQNEQPYIYTLEGMVTDVTNQTLSQYYSKTVHAGNIYMGINAPTLGNVNEVMTVNARLADVNGNPAKPKLATLQWKKIEWNTVKKKGFGGSFRYHREKIEKVLKECDVEESANDLCSFKPESSGLYEVFATAIDQQGRKNYSNQVVYVAGSGYGAWKLEDSDRINLVADKQEYHIGDTAKILIQSPFEKAKALITYERNSITHKEIIDIVGNSQTLEIPIKKEHIPNFYVSVVLISGRREVAQESYFDLGKPSVKVGVINLPVSRDIFNVDIRISKDKDVYKPKEDIKLEFVAQDADSKPLANSELTVMVVDTGVLSLTNYILPNPMNRFYYEYGMGVTTSDARIHLVSQRHYGKKMDDEGGGGGRQSNVRKNFIPSAYFNPSVITDEQGKAEVQFSLPDSLTTYKVMVIGSSEATRFGSAEAEFKVNKEFIIRPNLPRFARVGDEFQTMAIVHNESNTAIKDASLNIANEGITLLSVPKSTLSIPPHSIKSIPFTLAAEEKGLAKLTFSGEAGNLSDAIELPLEINLPQPRTTVAINGSTVDFAKEQFIKPSDVFDSLGGLHMTLSSSILNGFQDEIKDLVNYPYDCMEQRVSKNFPLLLGEKIMKAYGWDEDDLERKEKLFEDTLVKIIDGQSYSGGYRFWPGSWADSITLSSYVGEFLIEAMNQGYTVPEATIKKLREYLNRELMPNRKRRYPLSVSEKLSALIFLQSTGQDVKDSFNAIVDKWNELTVRNKLRMMRLAWEIDPKYPLLNEWLRSFENLIVIRNDVAYLDNGGNEKWRSYSSSNRTLTSLFLNVLIKANPQHPLIEQMMAWLAKNDSKHAINTYETIAVLKAIKTYHDDIESNRTPNYRAMVQDSHESLLEASFEGYSLKNAEKYIPMNKMPDKDDLIVRKEGKGKVFYRLAMDYYPKKGLDYPLDQGIIVHKTLWNDKGEKITGVVPVGETLRVSLELVFLENSEHVVIEDPMVAGFEGVNLALHGSPSNKLASMQAGQKDWSMKSLLTHTEMRDDKALFFADRVPRGHYTLEYFVRSTITGDFEAPPTRVFEMYAPETYGQTPSQVVSIH